MKKLLFILGFIVILIAGGAWYILSGADEFIRTQIEKQGSKFLSTSVTVSNVDLALTEGRITISGIDISNPTGFSDASAFSLGAMTLDLGHIVSEPYTVQTVSIDAPEILYELDTNGQGNLIVLKEQLTANLPQSEPATETSEGGANPLVIVENVSVSNVQLKLDFENLPTDDLDLDLDLDTKSYEITLPTFSAGAIGKPNGMPADQVGAAIVDTMLENVIAQAKLEAKNRLKDLATEKAKQKIDQEKGKLKEKATDKLKGLFGNG
jgi:hypothetical protein